MLGFLKNANFGGVLDARPHWMETFVPWQAVVQPVTAPQTRCSQGWSMSP